MMSDRVVLCKLCKKEFRHFGNTSNLRSHLRRLHPDHFTIEEVISKPKKTEIQQIIDESTPFFPASSSDKDRAQFKIP